LCYAISTPEETVAFSSVAAILTRECHWHLQKIPHCLIIALSLTDRTIVTRVNFAESERKAAISQWITDIVLSYKAKEC
jgi:hypothetical protein